MTKRVLVTTALEETWDSDSPTVFLGEWCKVYKRSAHWNDMDYEVVSYHWDDREKLEADYHYLMDLHERLLADLSVQLNALHRVNHSVRYWRILVGLWLGYFTQMLFDRWSSVEAALERTDLSHSIVLYGLEDAVMPGSMGEFEELFVGDLWNHFIFAHVLRFKAVLPLRAMKWSGMKNGDGWAERPSRRTARVLRAMRKWPSQICAPLYRETDVFLIDTYLPPDQEARLRLRFHQAPLAPVSDSPKRAKQQPRWRSWLVSGAREGSPFEAFVRSMIPLQMPTTYLEGYEALLEHAEATSWPKRPAAVFTSTGVYHEEVFKAWAAGKVDEGAPLIIGQHGGHYGIGRYSFVEEHEIAISDRYLSWGWSDSTQPKVEAVGQLKMKKPLGVNHSRNSDALLVTTVVPRYSYHLYSIAVSRQWLDYFGEQLRFVSALSDDVRSALRVRLYPRDFEWGQVERWRAALPQIRVADYSIPIEELVRQCRIYISTYNATTFLESLSMNVPTVIFWNQQHWELRKKAVPFFERLTEAGIMHSTPESAGRHISNVWRNVDEWWSAQKTREVVGEFVKEYCEVPSDLLARIEHILRQTPRTETPV